VTGFRTTRMADRAALERAAQLPATAPSSTAEPYNPAWDIDMIGDSRMEYDGPRCDYCGDTQTVDDGDRLCPDCIGTGAA